jgi:hypothetical protein
MTESVVSWKLSKPRHTVTSGINSRYGLDKHGAGANEDNYSHFTSQIIEYMNPIAYHIFG